MAASYATILARNIRAARARCGITQTELAQRMSVFGYTWRYQTIGVLESGRQTLYAKDLLALAVCLETTLAGLVAASPEDVEVDIGGGWDIPATSVMNSAYGRPDIRQRWDRPDGGFQIISEPSNYRPQEVRQSS